MGGAAASGPSLAKMAADKSTLADMGITSAVEAAPVASSLPGGAAAKIVNWIRRVGIPPWKMDEIKRRAMYDARGQGLDPDLACLRSVSPGWKAREQRRRNLDRQIQWSLSGIGRQVGIREFEKQVQVKFGQPFSWYD